MKITAMNRTDSQAMSPRVTVSGVAGNRRRGYPRFARHGDELVFVRTESTEGQTR
jgi:hypothetical protein